jgi:hypothetical protein
MLWALQAHAGHAETCLCVSLYLICFMLWELQEHARHAGIVQEHVCVCELFLCVSIFVARGV